MTATPRSRNRWLEFLIVLAVLFWFPQFWLAERIVWKREQQRRRRG